MLQVLKKNNGCTYVEGQRTHQEDVRREEMMMMMMAKMGKSFLRLFPLQVFWWKKKDGNTFTVDTAQEEPTSSALLSFFGFTAALQEHLWPVIHRR